jgi:hypothetical protein
VTIPDQNQRGIPMAVPANTLGSSYELIHFLLGQVLPAPNILVPRFLW